MKKTFLSKITYALFGFIVICFSNQTIAQNQLTPATQTSNLSATVSDWTFSRSDINQDYFAIVCNNDNDNGNSIQGSFLKVYDATTFAATSPQVQFSSYSNLMEVAIDNSNNIYVLYTERDPGLELRAYLKKFNSTGTLLNQTQISTYSIITGFGDRNIDLEVAPNGDVLVTCVRKTQTQNQILVQIYSNMTYMGYKEIMIPATASNNSAYIAMNGNDFVVGANHYLTGNIHLTSIYRFTYSAIFSGVINQSPLISSYTESTSGTTGHIALRSNGDVFYSRNSQIRKLSPGGTPSTFEPNALFVAVDINDKVITSYSNGNVKLFDNNDNFIVESIVDDEIKNSINSLSIYDCNFLVTGVDTFLDILEPNSQDHTFEVFHQLFGCVDCSLPEMNLPKEISICNENFEALCGPVNNTNLSYVWYFNDPILMQSVQVSTNQCYTPTQYGSYTLIVTNQCGTASIYGTINVVEGTGPAINIKDVFYCKAAPAYIGFIGPYSDALSYDWTYNDGTITIPVQQPTGYEIPNMGDGEYCVTITWSDANIPNLAGCTSTTCFTVQQCCEPNPEFEISWSPAGSTGTVTVENIALNTPHYDFEQFVLYQDCGNGWVPLPALTVDRSNNFNDPVIFDNLDKDCSYKVVHRVSSNCLQQSFAYEGFAYGQLKISVYPNPVQHGSPVTIEMTSFSEESIVQISDIFTGNIIYVGTLTHDIPIVIEYSTFLRKGNGSPVGIYNIKAYNSNDVVNKKLIVR